MLVNKLLQVVKVCAQQQLIKDFSTHYLLFHDPSPEAILDSLRDTEKRCVGCGLVLLRFIWLCFHLALLIDAHMAEGFLIICFN